MSEKRRLQGEIDKTLKRLEEGVLTFRELCAEAEENPQKDKLEVELKKEIKRLQRLRDQLKVWISSADVKDKAPLEEGKASVEKEMERYKSCERLFKTKAFSKEGLAQKTKQEVGKERHRKWINNSLITINSRIVSLEAELGRQRRAGTTAAPPENDEAAAQQLQWLALHRSGLESVLRRLEGDNYDDQQLNELAGCVESFLEHYQEPSYVFEPSVFDSHYDLHDHTPPPTQQPPARTSPVYSPSESAGQQQQQPGRPAQPAVASASSSSCSSSSSSSSVSQPPAPAPDSPRRDARLEERLRVALLWAPKGFSRSCQRLYLPAECKVPACFPRQPSVQCNSLETFVNMEQDTLFFAFFYQPGTWQQLLAAQQLKQHNWRYHRKYLTWFQAVHSEGGSKWLYFDATHGWCTRAKNDFSSETCWLEGFEQQQRQLMLHKMALLKAAQQQLQ